MVSYNRRWTVCDRFSIKKVNQITISAAVKNILASGPDLLVLIDKKRVCWVCVVCGVCWVMGLCLRKDKEDEEMMRSLSSVCSGLCECACGNNTFV